jgi:diaminopimelate decarboxylase
VTAIRELARRYGTPAYVYQLDEAAAAAEALIAQLPQPSSLYFSLKANPHPEVAATLRETGCGAEISSTGELAAALDAGFPAERCLVTGPGKADDETREALQAGVRLFSVESVHQLCQLDRLARATGTWPEVLLRLNFDGAARAGLRMTGRPSQFGFAATELAGVANHLRELRQIRVCGVHTFAATNVADEDALIDVLSASIGAARQVRDALRIELRHVDLGGGFAAPHGRPGKRQLYPALRARLTERLDQELPGWRHGDPAVSFESGRYLTATCGTLVCSLLDVKESCGRTFAVADAGVNHLGGLAATGRVLRSQLRPLMAAELDDDPVDVDLVGPLCTPVDLLSTAMPLSAPRPGSLVELPNVGAYGLTASLVGFLSRPLPVEVCLRGDRVTSSTRLQLRRITSERQGA